MRKHGGYFFMRKTCIIFLLSIIITLTALGFSGVFWGGNTAVSQGGEYLRIHIRAESNDEKAQAVKYRVRDEIVEYLTPIVAECPSKEKAMQNLSARLSGIAEKASETLAKYGFAYGATAQIKVENFPTRVYSDYIFPAGEYTALIINLGSGQGDNWWCVVYPPLCFSATENVVYKSKIAEIIHNFQAQKQKK